MQKYSGMRFKDSRFWNGFLVIALVAALLAAFTAPAAVQADGETVITAVFSSLDATNIAAYQLNGYAALDGDRLLLTPSVGARYGAAGDSTTFEVVFDPSAPGVRTAALSIANNDGDENPYNFSIQGTGVTPPSVTTSVSAGDELLLHQFDFDGDLNDTKPSGISLSVHPNTASSGFGSGEWWWTAGSAPGGGLTLLTDDITDPQNYSLGFRIEFDQTGAGYKKIVSFKDVNDDNGLYFLGSNLVFYPFGSNNAITYSPGEFYDFVFTRSSADVIKVYIVEEDGTVTKVYEENDATDASVPVQVGADYQFMFFMDDIATSGEWTTGGTVRSLRAWDGPLAESDIGYALGASATNITASSVTLNGALTSLGAAASVDVYFEYGLTDAYGSSTAAVAKDATGAFSAAVAGLTPGATYHFRAVADGDGTGYGADMTFTTLASEISVTGNSVVIADGDDSPSLADHTDFGSVDIDAGTVTRTFTIGNTGTSPLNLAGDPKVAIGGAGAADFTVAVQPSSPVNSGSTATFQVTFNPSSGGLKEAAVSIANDDTDENPFDFTIRGRGTKMLMVTGVTADNKVYDGATTATPGFGAAALVGVVGEDVVTLDTSSASAAFDTPGIGEDKAVTVSGLALAGANAANYTLVQPAASADITPRALTVTGITAAGKTYDGNAAATLDTSAAVLAGVVDGDTVTLDTSGAVGAFVDSAVGSGKTVTISGLTIGGADAGNYTLTQPDTTASINAAPSPVGPAPAPVPDPEPGPEPEPEPEPETGATGNNGARPIAVVDTENAPIAAGGSGRDLEVTGSLITVSGQDHALRVNIPVALGQDDSLESFTDSAGLKFEDNKLVIPASSAAGAGSSLLQIEDENGDLGTEIVIETGEAVGDGGSASAEVKAIKSGAGFTEKDLSGEDPSVGQVASTVDLDLNTLPDGARVKITTSRQADPDADSAFQLAAAEAGMGKLNIAYTINVEKTNLANGTDIRSAAVTMSAGREWVEANGGIEAVRIIRWDSETGTRQVLETRFLGYDEQGRAMFEGVSPDGLSVFALAGRKAPGPVEETVVPLAPATETAPSQTMVPYDPAQLAKGDGSGFPWWIIALAAGLVVSGSTLVIAWKRRRD